MKKVQNIKLPENCESLFLSHRLIMLTLNEVINVVNELSQDQGKEINTPPVHDLTEGNVKDFIQTKLKIVDDVIRWPEKADKPIEWWNGYKAACLHVEYFLKTPNPSKSNESNGSP